MKRSATFASGGNCGCWASGQFPSTKTEDLLFLKTQTLPGHSNGMRYTAFDHEGAELYSAIFYSVGGGFVFAKAKRQASRN